MMGPPGSRSLSEALPQDEVERLLQAFGAENWRLRRQAVAELSAQSASDATRALIDLIRNSHRDLSRLNAAMQTLAQLRADISPELFALLESTDAELRTYVAIVLGDRKDGRAVPRLIELLKDGNS